MAKAWNTEKSVPLLAFVMSIVLGDVMGFHQVPLLSLEGVKCLEDDV